MPHQHIFQECVQPNAAKRLFTALSAVRSQIEAPLERARAYLTLADQADEERWDAKNLVALFFGLAKCCQFDCRTHSLLNSSNRRESLANKAAKALGTLDDLEPKLFEDLLWGLRVTNSLDFKAALVASDAVARRLSELPPSALSAALDTISRPCVGFPSYPKSTFDAALNRMLEFSFVQWQGTMNMVDAISAFARVRHSQTAELATRTKQLILENRAAIDPATLPNYLFACAMAGKLDQGFLSQTMPLIRQHLDECQSNTLVKLLKALVTDADKVQAEDYGPILKRLWQNRDQLNPTQCMHVLVSSSQLKEPDLALAVYALVRTSSAPPTDHKHKLRVAEAAAKLNLASPESVKIYKAALSDMGKLRGSRASTLVVETCRAISKIWIPGIAKWARQQLHQFEPDKTR